MSDSKLSSRPPSMGGERNSLDEFIDGAGIQTPKPPGAIVPTPPVTAPEPYPWEAPGVRTDVAKVFNLRLPEPDLLKLKYIAEHTPESMQQFCRRVLLPAIEAKIQELTDSTRR